MPTLPEPPSADATRLTETLAGSALRLDRVIDESRRAADDAVYSHARTVGVIADLVVSCLRYDPDYRPSETVINALGGMFAEGELWLAAQRAGYLSTQWLQIGDTPGETPSGEGILERIKSVVPNTTSGL